jgi:hypothetical protein
MLATALGPYPVGRSEYVQSLVYSGSGYVVTEPEAQNYFPATAMAALVDAKGGAGIGVSFISSHGVSSLTDGTLEVMLHRRMVDIGCRVDQGCASLYVIG